MSILLVLTWLSSCLLAALTLEHKGLLSGWILGKFEKAVDPQLGIRLIPEFHLEQRLSEKALFDVEFSLNAFGTVQFSSSRDPETDGEVSPYRLWARFSLSQFEARIGLQKINFGSATLLRPLMWFDSLDPRDPLQLTDGVHAVLARYYFVSNTNLWFWVLYGNDDLKGWESIPTAEDTAEAGGRAQVPVLTGELALTYHHRRIDLTRAPAPLPLPGGRIIPEHRFGLDGKWDVGVGVWFEGAWVFQDSDFLPVPWQRAINIGLDYTFDIGNGLYLLGEHFRLERVQKAFGPGDPVDFSALLVRYPLSIQDDIAGIFYYDWDNGDFYRFLNWQRTYDRWRIVVIGFWNPEAFQIYPTQPGRNPFTGKGFQVMVVFNY